MAWLLRTRKDEQRFQPKIIPTPECPSHEVKTAYREKHGYSPSGIFAAGNTIEDRFWPEAGRFQNDVDVIPPILGLCAFYLISDSWRQVIEEFEPGVHQFKHVPLTFKDGSPLEERCYAMNIRQVLYDVADRERSTAPYKVYGNGIGKFLNTSNSYNARVYFFRESLEGYHLWIPRDVSIYNIAMSNELFDRISQLSDMKTIDTLEIEEV
ncbi:MAG: DUF1629 domain-containing protein [Pseudomonadota bacterium]|nr:DUF1629 domain-containing protein [Pseudomonadota bacterium]